MLRVLACVSAVALLTAAVPAQAQEDVERTPIGPSVDEPSLYGAFLAAQGAIHAGDSVEGAKRLVAAAQAVPGDATLRERAFAASLVNGDVTTAARYAPADGDPSQLMNGLGRLTQAVEALATGRGAEADKLLAAKVPFPTHVPVLLLRPYAAAEAGDWARATAAHDAEGERLVQLIDRATRAELLELHGQYDEAETLWRALAADPVASAIFEIPCGEFLERRGKTKDAIAIYTKALEASPNSTTLLAARARAEHGGRAPTTPTLKQAAAETLTLAAVGMSGQRQAELALIYARLAIRLDPQADQAWLVTGDALTVAHDDAAARAAWAEVEPGSHLYVEAQARSAYSLQRSGDAARALAVAEAVARSHPDSTQAAFVLADLQRSTNHLDAAATTLDRLVEQSGSNDWRVLYMRANVRDQLGHWDLAESDLRRAIALAPNEPEILNYLGYQWIDKGENVVEGLRLVEKAVAARPNSGAMQDSLGWAHFRLGDYSKAVELLEKAVTLEPADPDINDHLGDAYWMAGRKDEAGFQWRRVLSLDPDAKLKASAEGKLKNGLGPRAIVAGK